MAPRKKGTKTGRLDTKMRDIMIGDHVRTDADTPYVVNKYGNLENPVLGSVQFRTVTDVTLISSSEYEELLKALVSNRTKVVEMPKVAETEEIVDADIDNIPEAPAQVEEHDEVKEAVKESEEVFDDEAILATFSDDELILELRGRGYSGSIRKPITTYKEVEL